VCKACWISAIDVGNFKEGYKVGGKRRDNVDGLEAAKEIPRTNKK
jgi:hypothetical protein